MPYQTDSLAQFTIKADDVHASRDEATRMVNHCLPTREARAAFDRSHQHVYDALERVKLDGMLTANQFKAVAIALSIGGGH